MILKVGVNQLSLKENCVHVSTCKLFHFFSHFSWSCRGR